MLVLSNLNISKGFDVYMQFYGLLGEKLGHSLSPEIHKQILSLNKLEGAYKLFEINKDELSNFTQALKLLKIKGVNVTIPYKQSIMKYLDFISEEAKEIGAINTILLKENKLYGYNTDYYGFGYMLKISDISTLNKTAVILGNGGACKACVKYLLDNGINNIYIASRNVSSDLEIKSSKVKIIGYDDLSKITGDILINSTPVGMYPNVYNTPVSENIINNFNVLVDLIYNPLETKFLTIGKSLGKKTINGLYMLVGQAVKAQEIWNDRDFDRNIVEDVYNLIKKCI